MAFLFSAADENEDFSRIDDATNSDDFDVREPGWGSVARGILGRRSGKKNNTVLYTSKFGDDRSALSMLFPLLKLTKHC